MDYGLVNLITLIPSKNDPAIKWLKLSFQIIGFRQAKNLGFKC